MDDEQKEGCAMLFILAIGVLLWIICETATSTAEKRIETKELIQPEIRLTTDGKTVDTLYVYKTKP